jgi:Ser/Thr protein kinase RdoA (MazF antagonist)
MRGQASGPYREALARVAVWWGIEDDGAELLRDGLNHVFAGRLADGQERIIRVTDDRHRTAALIGAELSWLAFLSEGGCAVPKPIAAKDGALVRSLRVGEPLIHVVCFTWLDGAPVNANDPKQWTPELFADLGRELGRIHALSERFEPEPGARRYVWYQETEFRHLADFRRKVPGEVLEAIETHIAGLRARPVAAGTYGLIHNDVYADNFFYKDGEVQLFDFDQACYGWYVYDLICPLYPHYALPPVKIPGATAADAAAFFGHLVAGYRETHVLRAEQLALAGDLLRLKEMFVYLIMMDQFDQWATTLNLTRKRLRHALDAIEARLVAGAPVLDLDFTRF